MAIDALRNRSMESLKETPSTAKTVTTKTVVADAKTAENIAEQKPTDAVLLTDTAKTLSKATTKAKEASGIDEAKVAKIKASIEDGSYKINYESIANKLVDSEDELSSIFG